MQNKRLLTRKEAAVYLSKTEGSLATAACRKTLSIPIVRLNRAVRYDINDLDAFISKNKEQINNSDQEEDNQ